MNGPPTESPTFDGSREVAQALPEKAIKTQPFLDWKGLKAGPHAVGFRAIATADATRSFRTPTDFYGRPRADFGNRPIQISLWYPAEFTTRSIPMTYGDYVALLAWELGPPKTDAAARRTAEGQFIRMSGVAVSPQTKTAFESLYLEPVGALRDAKPAPGRFPVLICAPGQGYPAFDNSVMAEYLASHGFIVLASPSFGPDGREMPDSPAAIEAEARDLEYLSGYAQSLLQADPDRMAAMGFSLGGSSAALFSLRNARIKAFISLDGVLRDDHYLSQMKMLPQFQPEGFRGSVLWIACGPANSLPGFGEGSFQDQVKHAELVKAVFPGLLHHDFSSMSSLQRRRAENAGKDWSSATASYEAACRLILGFLESRVSASAQKLPQEPEALCRITLRPAQKAPPTPADLRETATREGIPAALGLLTLIKKEHPNLFRSFEEPLAMVGFDALKRGDATFALQAFALALDVFPDSIDAAWGMGKVHMAEGRFEQAEPHYRSARSKVETDPTIPADQKPGILGRIDKILEEIRVKRGGLAGARRP